MTIDTRWFMAQLSDNGLSQRKLAKLMGLDSGAISLMFRGKRAMKFEEAGQLARLLNVPVSQVLAHAGMPLEQHPTKAPLVGWLDGEGEAHLDWSNEEHVICPPEMPPTTVAIVGRMDPGSPLSMMDGWFFYFERPTGVAPDLVGHYAIVKLKDGVALVRNIRRGHMPGTYMLYSTIAASIDSAKLEWGVPIRWMRS